MEVINLMEILGDSAKEEEIVEGMQGEDEEEEEGEEEGPEYDEHIWLSLKNAEKCVDAITDVFAKVDSEDASAYNDELAALDSDYTNVVNNAENKTLLFGDRFPFRYMIEDYGLSYYAAFIGCSAESEASFETISFLANKVDELELKYVITIDGSNKKIAETIIENTKSKDQEILTLDSMQSVNKSKINSGITYLSVMKSNLAVLQKALS